MRRAKFWVVLCDYCCGEGRDRDHGGIQGPKSVVSSVHSAGGGYVGEYMSEL